MRINGKYTDLSTYFADHFILPAKAREYVLPVLVCGCVCWWPR